MSYMLLEIGILILRRWPKWFTSPIIACQIVINTYEICLLKQRRPASNLRLQVSCLLAGLLLVTTVSARRFRVHILFMWGLLLYLDHQDLLHRNIKDAG